MESPIRAHENGKGKDKKGKGRKSIYKCTNCKLRGHTSDNCFAKGGGKEHEAPEWWKQKQEARAKETKKTESANAAAACLSKCENHAYVTVGPMDFVPLDDEDFASLIITSSHNHKVYGVSSSTDLIVDCGASSHFLLTKLSLSILRQSRLNLFELPTDIPFPQLDVVILSLLFL